MTIAAALNWWEHHLGDSENPPGSNRTPIWDEYAELTGGVSWQTCPYCGAGVVCACRTGGFEAPANWIGVYAIQSWGEARRRFHRGSAGVRKGDVLIIGGPGVHTEQARGDALPDGSVPVYGTNTSPGSEGSQYNGGTTAKKVRAAGEIYGYVVIHDLFDGKRLRPHPIERRLPQPQYRPEPKRGALRLWEQGPRVEKLQELLGVPADGYYGHGTVKAVADFKSRHGLGGTGEHGGIGTIAGRQVLELLRRHGEPRTVYKTLRRGDKGGAVRKLQRRLIAHGYLADQTGGWRNDDGDFGPVTVRAVKKVEKAIGRKQNGTAGIAVWKALAA